MVVVTTPSAPLTTVTVPTTTTLRPLTPKDVRMDITFLVDETEDEQFTENIVRYRIRVFQSRPASFRAFHSSTS